MIQLDISLLGVHLQFILMEFIRNVLFELSFLCRESVANKSLTIISMGGDPTSGEKYFHLFNYAKL